jgi:hypothetical protein
MKKLVFTLTVFIFLGTFASAQDLTIPNSFSSGDVISASEMNANFTAVETAVNNLMPFDVYQYSTGPWDMSASDTKSISYDSDIVEIKVIFCSAMILNDSQDEYRFITEGVVGTDSLFLNVTNDTVDIKISAANYFTDNISEYDGTTYDRGVVTLFVLK